MHSIDPVHFQCTFSVIKCQRLTHDACARPQSLRTCHMSLAPPPPQKQKQQRRQQQQQQQPHERFKQRISLLYNVSQLSSCCPHSSAPSAYAHARPSRPRRCGASRLSPSRARLRSYVHPTPNVSTVLSYHFDVVNRYGCWVRSIRSCPLTRL